MVRPARGLHPFYHFARRSSNKSAGVSTRQSGPSSVPSRCRLSCWLEGREGEDGSRTAVRFEWTTPRRALAAWLPGLSTKVGQPPWACSCGWPTRQKTHWLSHDWLKGDACARALVRCPGWQCWSKGCGARGRRISAAYLLPHDVRRSGPPNTGPPACQPAAGAKPVGERRPPPVTSPSQQLDLDCVVSSINVPRSRSDKHALLCLVFLQLAKSHPSGPASGPPLPHHAHLHHRSRAPHYERQRSQHLPR